MICNKDCFACPYPDCIKEQHRAYYLRHREEILARQKEYNRRRAAEKRAARERKENT